MDDTNKTKNKENKKVARSKKNAAKKTVEATEVAEITEKKTTQKSSSLINDGRCCRCSFRKEKKCSCKNSKEHGKYVARKCGCSSFKYSN